jgi:hypothetical protein
MPGQFQKYASVLTKFRSCLSSSKTHFNRLQEEYAEEFAVLKPDKKLRWLPYLGTAHLELQLEDRTVEADVSPLEPAFIELFSEKSTYDDKSTF